MESNYAYEAQARQGERCPRCQGKIIVIEVCNNLQTITRTLECTSCNYNEEFVREYKKRKVE